jgi:uncharacterized membrane protein
MKTLKKLLNQPFQNSIPKWIVILLVVIAVIGFADSTYLTIEHFRNVIPPCTTDGCETVLTSVYSTIVGVPVSVLGSLYYLAILVLLVAYLDSKKEKALRIAMVGTTLGFIMSAYFFIIQAFVLHAFCQYCLLSALTSTILFVTSVFIFKKYQNSNGTL